ncbi:MAG: YeeE/YedE family protein [Cyclobacteriaceae bacterium]|nr:YeeE/YedE family protein [Cyclobacteriaceae bacterium]
MLEIIKEPWPWYVAGPLIGLMIPLLLFVGNRAFGISSSLRHICAICVPLDIKYFKYDWKSERWSLFFSVGILLGGILASQLMMDDGKVNISPETVEDLKAIGVQDFSAYLPADIFSWDALLSTKGLFFMAFGGLLVGFGTRYANGCTSGHSIYGLSNLQIGSLVATISFFVGGLLMTHLILPFIM